MISVFLYSARRSQDTTEPLSPREAARLLEHALEYDTAIVRLATDEDFCAFTDAMVAALRKTIAAASLIAGSSHEAWTSDHVLSDGSGWRLILTKKPLQASAASRANGAAARAR